MDIRKIFKGPKTAPAEQLMGNPKTELLSAMIGNAMAEGILCDRLYLHPKDYHDMYMEEAGMAFSPITQSFENPTILGIPVVVAPEFPLIKEHGKKTKHGNMRQRLYIPEDFDSYDTKNTSRAVQAAPGYRISTVLQGSSFNPSRTRSNSES